MASPGLHLPPALRAAALVAWVALIASGPATAADPVVEAALDDLLAAQVGLPMSQAYQVLRELVEEQHLPLLEQRLQALPATGTQAGYYLILTIRYLPGERSGALLLRLLDHPVGYLASRAAWALWSRKEEGWLDGYLERIADPTGDPDHRVALLGAFSSIRDTAVLDRVAALYDRIEEDEVRAAILQPLGYARDVRYIPLYRKGMLSEGPLTRQAAIKVLVAASDPAAIKALLELVDQGTLKGSDLSQVISAVRMAPTLTGELTGLLLELLERDLDAVSLRSLLPQVARTGDRGAVPRLRELLGSDDPLVAVEALRALTALEQEEDLRKTLAGIQEDADPRLRLAATLGRLSMGDRGAATDLTSFLQASDKALRLEAAQAFQEHLVRGALPALVQALREEDVSVRSEVVTALQNHLDAFFPYHTPAIPETLKGEVSLELREELIQVLQRWLQEQGL